MKDYCWNLIIIQIYLRQTFESGSWFCLLTWRHFINQNIYIHTQKNISHSGSRYLLRSMSGGWWMRLERGPGESLMSPAPAWGEWGEVGRWGGNLSWTLRSGSTSIIICSRSQWFQIYNLISHHLITSYLLRIATQRETRNVKDFVWSTP